MRKGLLEIKCVQYKNKHTEYSSSDKKKRCIPDKLNIILKHIYNLLLQVETLHGHD